MKKLLIKIAYMYTKKEFKLFESALSSPVEAQEKTLLNILKKTQHCFLSFKSLPLQNYDEILDIKKLTNSAPLFFELTSGSSGEKKEIPYTKSLIRDFTSMFKIWAHDILTYGPELKGGKIYFSLSPQFTKKKPSHMNDDSDYLSFPTSLLFNSFVLIPNKIKRVTDPDEFLKVTTMYLLSSTNLEIISVWSPSFLLNLLESVFNYQEDIENALLRREYKYKNLTFHFPKTPLYKHHELRKPDISFQVLFPHLKIISCWGALNSKKDFYRLKKIFPNTLLQEKGLLATEAPISIPCIKYNCFLPLLNNVYYEFLDDHNNILKIHEVVQGETYELIISQSSGLLRYKIGDLVRITKKISKTPSFEFLNRADCVSDLVGEKINETFLQIQFEKHNLPQCILIPCAAQKCYYCFSESDLDEALLNSLLEKNPHYLNAIMLKQLSSLKVIKCANLTQRVKAYFVNTKSMKLGDIKDQILYHQETNDFFLQWMLNNQADHKKGTPQ